tara:strand:+ start:307 stop:591 length:285 start_codon:yes stop_codon:yes gene_type:complete
MFSFNSLININNQLLSFEYFWINYINHLRIYPSDTFQIDKFWGFVKYVIINKFKKKILQKWEFIFFKKIALSTFRLIFFRKKFNHLNQGYKVKP